MKCHELCRFAKIGCPNRNCRLWIDYQEDLNCTAVAVQNHDNLTLRDVGDRLGISYVRVKQIQDAALKKLNERLTAK